MTHPPLVAGRWSIVGASVAGAAHAKRQAPCQDAFRVWQGPHGIAAIAVTDGAGSAENAALGSAEAAELAVGALRAHFLRPPLARPNIYRALQQAFRTVRDELEIFADTRKLPLASLATTLTLAVLMPDCLAVAQTGDGLIAVLDDRDQLKAVTKPQSGEYANETFFITAEEGALPGIVEVFTPVSALAVLTDGLLPIAADYKERQPHRGFFDPMFVALRQSDDPPTLEGQLAAFLDSDRVNAHTDDDKTLVLAVWREGPAVSTSPA